MSNRHFYLGSILPKEESYFSILAGFLVVIVGSIVFGLIAYLTMK